MPISFEYEGAAGDRDETRRNRWRESDGDQMSDAVEFHDADGVRWSVREASPSHVAAHVGRTSLIFESAVAVRRVWNYPEDWRAMSPEQLSALSWRV